MVALLEKIRWNSSFSTFSFLGFQSDATRPVASCRSQLPPLQTSGHADNWTLQRPSCLAELGARTRHITLSANEPYRKWYG
jgi:hypothetical protein